MNIEPSEPHKIVVRARFSNGVIHDVVLTPESRRALRECYRYDEIYFVNHRSAEEALVPYVLPRA